jgi:glycosyltransferase involved in cell wall biosynthesis
LKGTRLSTATVITPCRNAQDLVGRTAQSVMSQTAVRSGRLRLQYLICDGASRDGTRDVVRRICGDAAEIFSEPDTSMYHALAKGFRRAQGDIVSYLNAGDAYAPTALDVVADVFEQHDVEWITGLGVHENNRGQVISAHLPYRYRARLLRKGLYGTRLVPWYLQQESTFWLRRLISLVDLERLATFRLAGDSYLWSCFASESEPVIVESHLGAFAFHDNQLSADIQGYHDELRRKVREAPNAADVVLALFDRAEGLAPVRVRKKLNPRGLLLFDLKADGWR